MGTISTTNMLTNTTFTLTSGQPARSAAVTYADGNPDVAYTGQLVALPGRVEAENFDNGGEGVAYHDVTSANEGALTG